MQTLISYAMSFLGTPYKWGGDGRDGIDCSGLIMEILKSCGMAPPNDRTSAQLHDYFIANGKSIVQCKPACLCFYGSEKITHVAFGIDNFRIIEAAGGDRNVNTRDEAIHRNAWVRIRPYDHRNDLIAILMPNYPSRLSTFPS